MNRYWQIAAVALLELGLFVPGVAAQTFRGVQLARKVQTNSIPAFNSPNLFEDAFRAAWAVYKPRANDAVTRGVAAYNRKLPRGVTLYEQTSNLSGDPQVHTQLRGQMIEVQVTLKRNVLFAKSTTPTALGKWADPKFSVTYDLLWTVIIPVPSSPQALRVSKVTVVVRNAALDSQNLPADILKTVAAVVRFFRGPNFKGMAEASLNRTRLDLTGPVNRGLAQLNDQLGKLAREFEVLTGTVDAHSKRLVLTASKKQ